STAMDMGDWQAEQIRREVEAALPGARYVVTDLTRFITDPNRRNNAGRDGLPLLFREPPRDRIRGLFPFNQPVVFRSGGGLGRYVVHRVRDKGALADCRMPTLKQTEGW